MKTRIDAAALRDPALMAPGESSKRLGLAILGAVLFVTFSLSFDNYFSIGNSLTTAENMSSIAIASIGMMALLVSGNVDLSIGSQFALISVVTATVARDTQSGAAGAVAALGTGLLLGFINGVLVKTLKISPLIVTVGTLALFRGLAYVVANGVSVYGFSFDFLSIAGLHLAGIPMTVIAAAVVFVIGSIVLLYTKPGLRLYAIGGNADSARLVGIKVDRTVVLAFTFNGLLMGIVGLLATSRLASGSPNLGVGFEMDVLTAVILGGVAFAGGAGHPIGVLVGVFTIGVLNSGLIFAGFQDWWQQIAKGALLLAALGLDQYLVWYRRRRERRLAIERSGPVQGEIVTHEELRKNRLPVGDVVLEADHLSVSYGSIKALDDASVTVRAGEVVCLLGDNGAGKSTLIKAISGVNPLDSGRLLLDGDDVTFTSPAHARAAGIETVYQDLALCQNLGVAHNLVLGEEPVRRFAGILTFRDDRTAIGRSRERLARLGVTMTDFARPVRMLSGGQRQAVAISRVLRDDVKVVILDEPTAALGVAQTAQVLRLVRSVADERRAVILISHDIEDVYAVADRVVVMRLGRIIHDGPIEALDRLDLLRLMAGQSIEPSPQSAGAAPADTAAMASAGE